MATVGCMFSAANAGACGGTLYFKPPASWTSVYIVKEMRTQLLPTTLKQGEYYEVDLATYAPDQGWVNSSFSLTNTSECFNYSALNVNFNYFNSTGAACNSSSNDITCPGVGHSIYVMEDPLNPGHTYVGSVSVDAKYLYVKVPQNADWLWSTPMVREVGSSTGKAMTPVPNRCGWFFAVWDEASLPENAEIYDAAGHTFGGGSLPLSLTLSGDVTKNYYDADQDALTETDPKTNGSCISNGGTRFYFLAPDDKDWVSATPMLSSDGGATGTAMRPAPNMCGWYYMEWGRGSIPPDEVYIYSSDNPEKKIGFMGLWGEEDYPIPLRDFFMSWSNNIYFIPDDSWWPDDAGDSYGFFAVDPLVDGVCGFSLAALIYDTDQSLNPLFTSDGDNAKFGACTGVRHGIVKQDLGPDNKPVFNDGNTNAIICAGDEEKFSTLFNYTEGVNEVQCYDMPFRHYGTDPRWGFDSDSAASLFAGYSGFHPIENTSDATVVTSISPQPCPTCRTKRYSQGPVPVVAAQAANFDKYCNTYGWTGGVECEGKFNNGDSPAVWDWGATRWEGQHNQQFCFESHATFTYREDQEFTFRGDDDIWVFINKKLALDNGGAHLAAPGHVVLKNLNTTYTPGCSGDGCFLVPGKDYALDIFFCDRRTTMSNVIIKTNMFIKQSSGLSATAKDNGDGSVSYGICFDQSGDGSCAAVALGSAGGGSATIHACGAEISSKAGKTLKFSITTRTGELKANLTPGQAGWQYGGFDLSDPFNPKVNKDKINGLAPGSYRLVIDVCDAQGANCDAKAKTYINFRIKGNLDVMTQTSTYVVNAGDDASPTYKNNTKWEFVGKGLAGSRVPVYVSAFADGGVDLLSAVGQSYSLLLDKGMQAFASKTGETPVTFPKTVGATGIDTIWLYQDLSGMTVSPEKKTVKLKSEAVIEFYAPKLEFATPATYDSTGKVLTWKHPVAGDPDKDEDGEMYFHWIGSDVDLYVLIINPIDNSICKDCNIALQLGKTSRKVVSAGGIPAFTDGATIVSIRSGQEYMDSAATITVESMDMPALVFATYGNLHFREPPVPYPQLVDLFDARGTTLGALNIPEPYFSQSKSYLDGKGDSIAIHYHRPFQADKNGNYKDSLPHLICINWDEDHLEKNKFYDKDNVAKGVSTLKKDTAVLCSYIIDSLTIYKAFMARYEANGKKSDSVLTFVADSAFSVGVKTAGVGKVLNYAAFMEKTTVSKQHFDRGITDRMAPVIVAARVDNFNDQLNRLTVTFSEPIQMVNETNKNAPFSFYMNSATDLAEANRYASSMANAAPGGLGTAKMTLVYDKTQGTKNPTPRLGDYIRFRADGVMWSDTVNTVSEDIKRPAGDSAMVWNSPTDYNSTKRLPSPWVLVLGDYSVEVSAIKLATMNKDIDAKNTPVVDVFTVPTTMGKEEIAKLYPNTLGFIVKSDIASFMSKDSVTEKFFNEHPEALADVYFQYDVKYYTNLGTYVAGDKKKIYCLDATNEAKYGKQYYGGKDCRSVQGNFYIAWNMLSDKKRLVGTGAYIAKLSSFVDLGKNSPARGKVKESKAEETDMWGAKRGKGIVR